MVSVSRPPRKSQQPSAPPSSSPSSLFSQSEEVTGEPTLEHHTLCQPRSQESAVPSPSDSFQHQEELVLSPPQPSSDSFSSLVLRTSTPPLPEAPRLSRTPSRLPSSLSETHTVSLHLTCGRRPSSSDLHSRSSVTSSRMASVTRCCLRNGRYALGFVHVLKRLALGGLIL